VWADNETDVDLLGFTVHKDLVRQLVTSPNLLPVTVGVFGDWGGGKSSILKMLRHDLEGDDYKDVACLYFSGWMFEGYDDAKAALITSVLLQLGEHGWT
jgi:predicted KAP-like P-loop ATPase